MIDTILMTFMRQKKGRTPRNYYSSPQEKQEYANKLEAWYKNEYPKRKQAIENKINNNLSSLEIELKELNEQLLSVNSRKLSARIKKAQIKQTHAPRY